MHAFQCRVNTLKLYHRTPKCTVRLKDQLTKIIAKHTGQKESKVTKDSDRDIWMNASQAKEYGLIDDILEYPEPN